MSPPLQLLFLTYKMLLWTQFFWRVLKSRVIWGIILKIDMMQPWQMLSSLRVREPSTPSISDTPLKYLGILMVIYEVFVNFKSKSFQILSNNILCVTWISYLPIISLHMIPLCKRLQMNSATLMTQSGRIPLPEIRSNNSRFLYERLTLRKLISWNPQI